jgi:hypothetical protein
MLTIITPAGAAVFQSEDGALQAGHRRWIWSTIRFSANATWTQRQRYPQWGFNFKIGDLLNVPGFFKPDLPRRQPGGIRNIRSSTTAAD